MIKGKKLERCLIFILFIGIALFVIWRFDFFGSLAQKKETAKAEENRRIWMESARENLREDFIFLEGANYFLVKGRLTSECIELDPDSHCPVDTYSARTSNKDLLFMDKSRFTIPNEHLEIFPSSPNEGVNILGFIDNDSNKDAGFLEFRILDYIPNTELCSGTRVHGNTEKKFLCSIGWNKKIFLEESIPVKRILPIEITNFDYSFLNHVLSVSLTGELESDEAPDMALALYVNSRTKKTLKQESQLELLNKHGVSIFEVDEFFDVPHYVQNFSVLLLATNKNSFYAKEWVFENKELVEVIVYN